MLVTKKSYTLMMAIAALLLLIFAFTDLQISQAIATTKSSFGEFFFIYGESAIVIIMFLAGNVFLASAVKDTGWGKKTLLYSLGSIMIILSVVMHIGMFTFRLDLGHSENLFITLSVIIMLLMTLAMQRYAYIRFSTEDRSYLLKIAYTSVIYIMVTILVIEGIKAGWGRVRFRDLLPDYSNFSPWYVIQGEGGSSFPSGHSANSFATVALSLFVLPQHKRLKQLIFYGGFLWWFLTALSRVIYSAHYASDVTAGFMISLSILCLFYAVFHRNSSPKNWPKQKSIAR
ncbi:phosphatase PAP2 family protein [Paenibacillus faecalis]|uniref:phosphatase PAP2 family protein n=1 Tax=Paenibacillus faecalis TaxID=2079532 RepID=UPI000D0EF142|nr:phosphatase PAP2 family protein [Paenibacillus faecalis]